MKIENTAMNKAKGFYGNTEPREYNVSYVPHKSGVYTIEIDSAIESVSQFSTAIQVLGMAKENDEVEIHLSCCPGGSVDCGDSLIHAIRKCEAHVHMIATGGNHSMASQILLEADSFELSDSFNSLIHAGQDGAYGTVPEYHAKSAFDLEFRTRKFKEAYKYFLTEAELESVLKGQDLWLDAKGWCDRAVRAGEIMQAEAIAHMEAEKSAQEAVVAKPARPQKRPLTIGKQNAVQGPTK